MIETAGALLIDVRGVLLGLRAPHKSSAGCWDIFGGHMELDESPRTALFRELREELGLVVTEAEAMGVLSLFEPAEGPLLLHIFHVFRWEGEPVVSDDEHTELKWFSFEEAQTLSNLAAPEYRPLFAQLAGASQDAIGPSPTDPA